MPTTTTMNPEPDPSRLSTEPLLIILSGLSGVGKDAVLAELRRDGPPLEIIVTMTTRAMRLGEREGVPYHFISKEHFLHLCKSGEFLEWANNYGNYYGNSRSEVKAALEAGKDVLLKLDVKGAATIKRLVPESIAIFLATPTLKMLEERLRNRGTESSADLERRLNTAAWELEQVPVFDYLVMNDQGGIAKAAADVRAIITAEKSRIGRRGPLL
jgi:guanylate kinase